MDRASIPVTSAYHLKVGTLPCIKQEQPRPRGSPHKGISELKEG